MSSFSHPLIIILAALSGLKKKQVNHLGKTLVIPVLTPPGQTYEIEIPYCFKG